MYKKHLILIGMFLFSGALFIGFAMWHVTDKDWAAYQELIESSTPAQSQQPSYSQQARAGVLKEIWYQETPPLYIRIESDDSQLFFFHQEGKVEVVEQLDTVSCLMQEELFYEEGKPMQYIRYMEAKRAHYNYNTQLFSGEEAKLWRYRLEGHEPLLTVKDKEPIMSGTAASVEFVIRGKELDFQASHLKATFLEKEDVL